jgi:SPOR domain
MSNSQCSTEPETADVQVDLVQTVSRGASRLLKGLLIAFAATVTIGLALASWYVGVRIVSAKEATPSRSIVGAPAKIVSPSQPAPGLQPQPPDLYLQVAGLGPRRDASFLKELEAKGYRARIEVAPRQEDTRILIGPFAERRSLEATERDLQSAGVLAVETTH